MGCSVSDTRAISHWSLFARVSYCTLSVTFRSLLETKALDCQTILTVPLFVLLIKYAHIRAIVTRLACRVIARVSVHSPFSLFSRGGSQFVCKTLLLTCKKKQERSLSRRRKQENLQRNKLKKSKIMS